VGQREQDVPDGDIIYDEREENRLWHEMEREQASRVVKRSAAATCGVAHCEEEDDKGTVAGSMKEEEEVKSHHVREICGARNVAST
jgi:hypothetical protein